MSIYDHGKVKSVGQSCTHWG